MQDFERLGVFYLGRDYDLATRKPTDNLLLYDAKDLTTHAVCVGMTGSGKTGLCLALLEEAGIDNIPAIIIDPKGDLSNLLLTFPQLRPEDFEPWIDPEEAKRKNQTAAQFATATAEQWKKGLADWGQDAARIQRFRDAVDLAIYTPGSSAGLPLTVLRSFNAPPKTTRDDNEAMRGAVSAAASGLLGLLGIEADPLKSREHILISNILDRAWRDGKNLDMPGLIRALQTPGFDKIGVIDLESFFPAKDRFDLAMQLNNLLASPGFSAWMEGEPLDVQRLLYTPEGKPRLAILSIAHLSDAERMFFVTILLNEVLGWMRSQSGTSSLRALLYMDEVFGYFPPSKNPPSKGPMLTLLKQARAFGLGVVLATQNPVDLDYKGLSNCGTWFLGRLQTERDKLRVLDGLEGASSAAGTSFNRAEMDQMLSGLGNRVFLMNNVHEDHPVVFQSRWALSFLRGPLTREQISKLMEDRKTVTRSVSEGPNTLTRSASEGPNILTRSVSEGGKPSTASADRPILPPDVKEQFVSRRANLPADAGLVYHPALLGQAKLHFAQATTGVDCWQDVSLLLPIDDSVPNETWGKAETSEDAVELEAQPEPAAKFAALPGELSRPKRYTELSTALKDHLYRNQRLQLWKCDSLKQTSKAGESQADFRIRLSQQAREARDLAIEELRKKYAPKLAALHERAQKEEMKSKKKQGWGKILPATLTSGAALSRIISSLMRGKMRDVLSSANQRNLATIMRQSDIVMRDRLDAGSTREGFEAIAQQATDMEDDLKSQMEKIQADFSPDKLALTELVVQPKKSEINVSGVTLAWLPYIATADGKSQPAY
ncbi:MAG TPA: DUF87 domain-containing protein [Pirellulaceae bacterium]